MKSLFAVLAVLSSVQAHAAMVNCSMTDKDETTVKIQIDSDAAEGQITKVVKGVSTVSYNLHAYIMNDSIAGQYYYEGLARAPMTSGDPMFFTLKGSSDDTTAVLKVSEVGAEKKEVTEFTKCSFK